MVKVMHVKWNCKNVKEEPKEEPIWKIVTMKGGIARAPQGRVILKAS